MSDFNTVLSLLTVGVHILIGVLLFLFFAHKKNPLVIFFHKHALWIAFVATTLATGLTLFYSEIVGFAPCELCWYQRIFLYPQVVFFGVALLKKNDAVADTSLILSLCGGAIALYQYYGQMFNPSALPCAADGTTSACAQRLFVEFGYITLPMMAVTIFAFLAVLMLIRKKHSVQ